MKAKSASSKILHLRSSPPSWQAYVVALGIPIILRFPQIIQQNSKKA